jgi:polysaccharide biosynthesis protein PslJ
VTGQRTSIHSASAPPFDRGAFLPAWPVSNRLPIDWSVLLLVFAFVAIVGAAGLGWIAVEFGVVVGVGLLVAICVVIAVLSDVRAGLWTALVISILLPFAVVPVRVGVTLTALEAVSLVLIGVWLARTLLYRDHLLPSSFHAAAIVLFMTVTLFAFLLGVGRGYTTQTYHDYAKFLMAIALVFIVWTSVRSIADHRRFLNVFLLAGSASALIGLIFQVVGPGFAERMLARLIPLGYPDTRIVRFIEDDPGRAMRLVSTSVDPNSAGGMLAIVFIIGAVQLISRQPLIARWICLTAVPLTGLALLLTYSRGAWLGAAAGLAIVGILRYRWLIPAGVVALGGLMTLGFGAAFIERLWLGFTLQDPATVLRLREYQNAIAIIREYPLFGVGFGDAPSIELQTGVSSVYLTIGQQAGLLGLIAFLLAVCAAGVAGLRWWFRRQQSVEGDLMLTFLAVLGGIITIGVFDHYFFNIQFPHMAAMLWIVIGLILAIGQPIYSGKNDSAATLETLGTVSGSD